jgi:DNA-directed RNA polymerase specialized sigma24 family protein
MENTPCTSGDSAHLDSDNHTSSNRAEFRFGSPLLERLGRNINSLARKYSSKRTSLDFEDARQELILGVLIASERVDSTRSESEIDRYLLYSAECHLRSAIDCVGGVRCPSQKCKARNRALTKKSCGQELSSDERETLGALVYQFLELDSPSFIDHDKRFWCTAMNDLDSDLYVKLLMEKLPTQVAQALCLIFIKEYKYSESAKLLQVSDSQLRSYLQVGKRMLQKELVA